EAADAVLLVRRHLVDRRHHRARLGVRLLTGVDGARGEAVLVRHVAEPMPPAGSTHGAVNPADVRASWPHVCDAADVAFEFTYANVSHRPPARFLTALSHVHRGVRDVQE